MESDQRRRVVLSFVVLGVVLAVFVASLCRLSYNLGRLHEYERTHPWEPKFELFGE